VNLTNCTVTGNGATGLAANGGGVAVGYRGMVARNSIVSGNTAASDAGPDISGVISASNGRNIFGSEVDGSVTGDLMHVSASSLFAGGLADHGGRTPTIALRDAPDNPALSGGNPADAPPTDQRGLARPSPAGTDPDIGAFEHPWLSRPADALEYVASYPDLVRALGPDAAAGAAHYRHYGAVEGRQVGFDGLEYIASYADLITALGANREAGSVHFIDHGAAESRQTSFDGLQYIASHEDLIRLLGPSADAGAVHYIRFGAGEGRHQDDFDAEQYLANHADLQVAFGSDTEAATVHFIRYGHGEGRTDAALDLLL
jgi:hypothetical protein